MATLPLIVRDQVRVQLYHEFYRSHRALYDADIRAYWRECSRFVDDGYRIRIRALESGDSSVLASRWLSRRDK